MVHIALYMESTGTRTTRLSGLAARSTRHIVERAASAFTTACRYGNATTTLKNRIAAFSATVAPSTAFHSPSDNHA